MPRIRPKGWQPKQQIYSREPRIKLCLCCYFAMGCNTHYCPQCNLQTEAGLAAEIRKHLKGR